MDSERLKILVCGDSGVGKKALIARILTGSFVPSGKRVSDVRSRYVGSGALSFRMFFWDTTLVSPMTLREVAVAVVLVDPLRPRRESVPEWIELVKKHSPKAHIMVGCSKLDLLVTRGQAREACARAGFGSHLADDPSTFEVSARTGVGVSDLVEALDTYCMQLPTIKRRAVLDIVAAIDAYPPYWRELDAAAAAATATTTVTPARPDVKCCAT